jgi:hypothetical protein
VAEPTTKTIGKSRIKTIAEQMLQACEPFTAVGSAEKDAKLAIDKVKAEGVTVRETIMARVSELATGGKWTALEIDAAAKSIGKNAKQNDRSKAVLVSQIKSAAKPNVREKFKEITTVVNEAWDEAEELKAAGEPAPLRKLSSRRYDLLCHVLSRVAAGKMAPDFTQDDLLAYAEECEREKRSDANKAAKKLEALVKQIDELHEEFRHNNLLVGANYLREIDVKQLQEARDRPNKSGLMPKTKAPTRSQSTMSAPQFLQIDGAKRQVDTTAETA